MIVKFVLNLLLDKFSLREINEAIAQIMYEKYYVSKNTSYDRLSEQYDEINRKFYFELNEIGKRK